MLSSPYSEAYISSCYKEQLLDSCIYGALPPSGTPDLAACSPPGSASARGRQPPLSARPGITQGPCCLWTVLRRLANIWSRTVTSALPDPQRRAQEGRRVGAVDILKGRGEAVAVSRAGVVVTLCFPSETD